MDPLSKGLRGSKTMPHAFSQCGGSSGTIMKRALKMARATSIVCSRVSTQTLPKRTMSTCSMPGSEFWKPMLQTEPVRTQLVTIQKMPKGATEPAKTRTDRSARLSSTTSAAQTPR